MNDLRKHADRLVAAATILAASGEVLVNSLAEVVRLSVSRQIGDDVPRRRVAGAPVGVKVKPLAPVAGLARAEVMATGPLHLENNPTKPHSIAPKGPHPLVFQIGGQSVFVNRVQHPGTRGKRTWQQGVDKAEPLVQAQIQIEGRALLRRLF